MQRQIPETYQVLARRYRPQQFQEVVGQDVIVTTLKNSLRMHKVAHAYLFCGSRGTGKTTLARLFAKALNCQNLQNSQEPCNECPSCLDTTSGQSLDVIEIDGASNRGIDDIRAINENIGYIPSYGKYKIYIIDEVHMLTKEAFNALLKTLEEPPEKAKFFFATTEVHKVLPTIISRCQRFDLKRIALPSILEKLQEIVQDLSRTVQKEALHLIAEKADGSLRDAESLLDQMLCFTENEITINAVHSMFGLIGEEHFFALDNAFSQSNFSYAFAFSSLLHAQGKDFAHIFGELITHYRRIALCKIGGEFSSPYLERYKQSALLYTQEQSLSILEYVVSQETHLQKTAVQRIFFETTLLHILKTKNKIAPETLLRKLAEIEKTFLARPEAIPTPSVPKQEILPPKVEIPKEPPKEASLPKQEILPKKIETPPPVVKEVSPSPKGNQEEETNKPFQAPEPAVFLHPKSRYDTLLRFAAVELEGTLRK